MSEVQDGTTAIRYDWTDVPADHPVAHISRKMVRGDHMMVGHIEVEEGFHVEPHVHHNEQITLVLEGRLRFRVGIVGSDEYRDQEVGAGQVMVLPPFVPHGITAIEDSRVFDLFSPTSDKTGIDQD